MKWVLWAGGRHYWSTASDNYHQAMRLALRNFGIPMEELFKDDKIVQNRWMSFIKDRHDGACLLQASPERGAGKTIPNKGEPIGFRMGNAEKVYPMSILHMVYEDEPKSTYVTRESAEAAIKTAIEWGGLDNKYRRDLADMLEDKPRQKVKAR
jgi:hypothetical protein